MTALDLASNLLDAIAEADREPNAVPSSADRPLRLAVVDPAYTGTGDPKVTFEGESTMSVKTYPYLGVKPIASQRVVLMPLGRGYVISNGDLTHSLETRLAALEARKLAGWVPIAPASVAIGFGTSATVGSDGIVTLTSCYNLSLVGLLTGRKRVKVFITIPTVATAAGYFYMRWMSGTTPNSSAVYAYGYSTRQNATYSAASSNVVTAPAVGYTSLLSGRSGNSYELDLDLTGPSPLVRFVSNYAASAHTDFWGSSMFDANLVPDGIYLTGGSTSTRWTGTVEAYELVRS